MNRHMHDFRELNKVNALDVYQPDVALSGGITQTKKLRILFKEAALGSARIHGQTALVYWQIYI